MSDADQPMQAGVNEAGVLHLSIGVNELARLGGSNDDPRQFARECLDELREILLDLEDDVATRASQDSRPRRARLRSRPRTRSR